MVLWIVARVWTLFPLNLGLRSQGRARNETRDSWYSTSYRRQAAAWGRWAAIGKKLTSELRKIHVVLLKAQLFAAAGVLMSSTPCYFLILRRYDGTTLVPPSHITKHVSKCHAPPVLADGKACCLIWGVFCLSEICPGRMETIVALAKTRLGYPGKGQN